MKGLERRIEGEDESVVTRALSAEARRLRAMAVGRLPSAESLLWRARLRARMENAERASRLLALYDRIALGVGAALLVGLVAVRWDVVRGWWPGTAAGGMKAEAATASASTFASGEAWLIATVVLAAAGFVVFLANLETRWVND